MRYVPTPVAVRLMEVVEQCKHGSTGIIANTCSGRSDVLRDGDGSGSSAAVGAGYGYGICILAA